MQAQLQLLHFLCLLAPVWCTVPCLPAWPCLLLHYMLVLVSQILSSAVYF